VTPLVVVAVGIASLGAWVWVTGWNAERSAARTWARSRGLDPSASEWRVLVDGVPVVITPGPAASATYVLGAGPRFELRGGPRRPPANVRVNWAPLNAAALVKALDDRYVSRGDADEIRPTVRVAFARVAGVMYEPHIVSDGVTVRVSSFDRYREPTQFDLLATLAAAIAKHRIELLTPIATALDALVEIGDDGLAFVAWARRATVRVTLTRSSRSTLLETTVVARLADTVREVDRLTSTLAALPGAQVQLERRQILVRFDATTPATRIRKAVDVLDAFLSGADETPYR
jgi:hypothetical protein